MTGSRSDVWQRQFGFAFKIRLFKGIEENDLIQGTRGPRNQGWTDTRRRVARRPRGDSFVDARLLDVKQAVIILR